MLDTLQLHSFALPAAIAPEQLPMSLRDFVRQCVPGLSKRQILSRMRRKGWMVTWAAERVVTYSSDDIETFAVEVKIDGATVSMVIRMCRVAQGTAAVSVPERDPRQLSLF
ncbi:hypothetical protein [Burkholderia anthina]|uniref:hypothetical protein n=1 Tax=Burkholderia anthina TaxID=179879 RepID=UPI001588DFD4|nr:hypothetical protein [Burkholderia anthina]